MRGKAAKCQGPRTTDCEPIYKDAHTTKTHKTHIYTTHMNLIRLVYAIGTHIRFIGFRKLMRFTHATKTHKIHHRPMCDS